MKVTEVAARMKAMEQAADKGAKQSVAAAALKAKLAIQSGAPTRLRGVGRSGARLGVSYSISASGGGPSARLRATGPWQLIEEDTSPHVIRPKKRKRGRASGRGGGVAVPGLGVRRSVHHPGTRGKHPWSKGVEKAEPLVAAEMRKQMTNTVMAAFRG